MTKEQVLEYLIGTNFDFKGKEPVRALNMTWAYLRYSNEDKRQGLLEIEQIAHLLPALRGTSPKIIMVVPSLLHQTLLRHFQ